MGTNRVTIHPVIMCGGAGTRLWPVSTQDHPKQFHRLVTDHTVFQDTVLRVRGEGFGAPVIVSNQRYAGLIRDQLDAIGVTAAAIILEPSARNTAAVAAVAARQIEASDPGSLALLLPSDHFIGNPDAFVTAVRDAAKTAATGYITTFGIRPDRPETGFGYIRQGDRIDGQLSRISEFKEKPELETALRYIADPAFSWNAGIFLFPASLMISELAAHAPDILEASTAALDAAVSGAAGIALDADIFATVRSTSVDYAVMEKTTCSAVYAPLDCAWNDIGTWAMIGALRQRNNDVEPVLIDAPGCSVHADADHIVALVGVENLSVVVEGNRILVTANDRTQDVGAVVKALRARGDTDHV